MPDLNNILRKKTVLCYLKINYVREHMYDKWIVTRNNCYGCKWR